MAMLTTLCSLAMTLGWLCCVVRSYPIGDLSLDGLLYGADGMHVSRRRRLAESDPCSYPGLVAVVSGGTVAYSGIYQAGHVRLPTDALTILKISNTFNDLQIRGGDGTALGLIARGTIEAGTVTNSDGTSSITMTTDYSSGRCGTDNAILYQSATMNVDVSTCKIVNYAGSTAPYSGTLHLDPLAQNNMRGCCSDVFPNILGRDGNLGNPAQKDVASSFTCLKSSQAICFGSIGSPVYCTDTRSGQNVVVAMVDSGTCQTNGEYFAAIDFTGGGLSGFSS